MDGVACKRGGDFPFVVVFVDISVDGLVVQEIVDPVDTHVSEDDESEQGADHLKIACNEKFVLLNDNSFRGRLLRHVMSCEHHTKCENCHEIKNI